MNPHHKKLYTPSPEEAEKVAAALYRLADRVTEAVAIVNIMGRAEWQTWDDEPACETLCYNGEEWAKTLRAIAMRLDRGVMGTYEYPPSILDEVR